MMGWGDDVYTQKGDHVMRFINAMHTTESFTICARMSIMPLAARNHR